MAHFFGELVTCQKISTRCAGKDAGLVARAQGWTLGVEVRLTHNPLTREDEVTVYVTGGSGSPGMRKLVGVWDESGQKPLNT